ncbi:MAG: hypothetical protein AB1Z31_09240 [Desulfobacterales bacterium]
MTQSSTKQGRCQGRNCKKAIEWCEKAAVQGHIWALEFLGFLYEQGECIPVNLIRAYAWYNLLTVQNPSGATCEIT